MTCTVVISQPMFLPWVGLFEQMRLADVYIHYDDVQMPQGRSFMSRVQIKTANGIFWLTAPIDRKNSGKMINETLFSKRDDWKPKHLKIIKNVYSRALYFDDMFQIVEEIYDHQTDNLSEFNVHAIEVISKWLGFSPVIMSSSVSGIGGSSSQRLLDLCKLVGADRYVTGLGALKYLDHERFDSNGVEVNYMDYQMKPYAQLYGEFSPYVSIIDAIANCGDQVRDLVCSKSIYWKNYVEE